MKKYKYQCDKRLYHARHKPRVAKEIKLALKAFDTVSKAMNRSANKIQLMIDRLDTSLKNLWR